MARWPVLPAALVALATERARRQAAFQAICHHVRIGARIVGLLWQLADRFGRVMPAAAVVPLGLTRETIAALIGAQRPSVTTALGSLRERHVVERRPDGAWVLRPETDAELARMFARTREIRTPEIEIIEEPPSPLAESAIPRIRRQARQRSQRLRRYRHDAKPRAQRSIEYHADAVARDHAPSARPPNLTNRSGSSVRAIAGR
jgi:hypothetical protein